MTQTSEPEFNPYAPPSSDIEGKSAADTAELVVSGRDVLTPDGLTWPDRCVVCGAPAIGYRQTLKLFWHHPAVYLTLMFNIIIYAIVAALVRRRATVHVGVCDVHRRRRRNGFLVGWLGLLTGIAMMIGAGTGLLPGMEGTLIVVGALLAVTCPIVALFMCRLVTVVTIKDGRARLRVGKPFLEYLLTASRQKEKFDGF